MSASLVFDHVSRWYGDTVALGDVSFTLSPGITGLLGHNGAGKTTALAICAGWAAPSQGTVRVLGRDPRRDPAVFGELGVVPDRDATWGFLTARATVEKLASQRRVARPKQAATAALARVGLTENADRRVGGFSQGMRQRVKLAQALAHDPQVLLLDEPLNGLDPAQRRHLVDLIVTLGAEGRTVLVSSHVLAEVERMADRVLVVVNGRLVAEGDPAGIRDLLTDRPRSLRIRTPRGRELARRLLALPCVTSARVEADGLILETSDARALAAALPGAAREAAATLRRVEPVGEDLESVFTYLTSAARGAAR
ncbi:MAG: ABC transporter ATP-binding protein [Actinomycetes bacterium]